MQVLKNTIELKKLNAVSVILCPIFLHFNFQPQLGVNVTLVNIDMIIYAC